MIDFEIFCFLFNLNLKKKKYKLRNNCIIIQEEINKELTVENYFNFFFVIQRHVARYGKTRSYWDIILTLGYTIFRERKKLTNNE